MIGVKLAVFCPAPQSAIADFQLGTGFGTPRASGDGLVNQNNCGLLRASARHLCSVASEIPSSCDSCRMAKLFGGSIRFSTANFRSGEYPTSLSYPAHLRNREK